MYERYSNREVWRAAKLAGRDAGLARGNGPDDATGNSLAMHWRTTGNETAPVDGALQAGREGWPSKGQDLVHVEKVHVEKAVVDARTAAKKNTAERWNGDDDCVRHGVLRGGCDGRRR